VGRGGCSKVGLNGVGWWGVLVVGVGRVGAGAAVCSSEWGVGGESEPYKQAQYRQGGRTVYVQVCRGWVLQPGKVVSCKVCVTP